jgi:hypothetical protein
MIRSAEIRSRMMPMGGLLLLGSGNSWNAARNGFYYNKLSFAITHQNYGLPKL